MDDFVALQQASREDKAEFMTPEMRRFFNAMAQRMMDKGWLQLSFLTINGEKAAVAARLRVQEALFALQLRL